jgi:hypothetical protein
MRRGVDGQRAPAITIDHVLERHGLGQVRVMNSMLGRGK